MYVVSKVSRSNFSHLTACRGVPGKHGCHSLLAVSFAHDKVLSALQEYTRQLGTCLMELQDDGDTPARQRLERWVSEINSLIVATSLSNPNGLRDFHLSKMDEGCVCHDAQHDDSYYYGVMVSKAILCTDILAMHSRQRLHVCDDSCSYLVVGTLTLAWLDFRSVPVTKVHIYCIVIIKCAAHACTALSGLIRMYEYGT